MHRTSFLFVRLCYRVCQTIGLALALIIFSAPVVRSQNPVGGGMLAINPTPKPAASAPEAADARFQPPKVIKHPSPAYPILALLNRAEGVVGIRFGIDDQGRVTTVSLAQGAGSIMLDSLVRDPTLHEWTFEPARLDGKPIASSLKREFEFRLDPEEQRQMALERLAAPEGLPNPPYPPDYQGRKPGESCTIGVVWTKDNGLVDLIYLDKSSGSNILDRVAVRWAFTHWRVNPANIIYPKDKDGKDKPFVKTVTFESGSGVP